MNHTWKIEQLEYNNDEHGGVITAHWRCYSTNGVHTATRYGSVGFTGKLEYTVDTRAVRRIPV